MKDYSEKHEGLFLENIKDYSEKSMKKEAGVL